MKIPLRFALLPFLFFLALPHAGAVDRISVTVSNEFAGPRPAEVILVPWREIAALLPGAQPDRLLVRNPSGGIAPSQFTNFQPEVSTGAYGDVLFQHDFAAGERSATFTIEKTPTPVPPFPAKVFARYVPERLDDFAWENDRIAHRIYGPGLDTPAAGKSRMISSGIDVWAKRVRHPIVDRWYLRGHDAYHKDNGEGLDFYSVDVSRGCGGTGIWEGEKLYVSHNWKTWKVLANGPIRTVFELTYAPWDAGGVKVSETKRFTVDAGHNLDQIESTFVIEGGKTELTAAIGIGKPKKAESELTRNDGGGWMSLWQKYPKEGELGCAVVLGPGAFAGFAEDPLNQLALAKVKSGEPLRYFAGAGWSRSGDFDSKDAWNAYVDAFAQRLRSPIQVVKIARD